MISRTSIKNRIVKISILLTIMFTHTGCFFGYFENPFVSAEKPNKMTYTQPNRQIVNVNFNAPPPTVECADNSSSACNKAPIAATELKPKLHTSTGDGEIHKLRSIQGEPITIIERSNGFIFPNHQNKIIILEMFGKKCAHCIKEMPILNSLRSKYGGKVEIFAVQVEDKMSASEAKRLIRRHKIRYPLISGESATNLQYNIQNTYGWTGILPFTMVIKNGVTEFTYPGEVSYNRLNNDIKSILR